MLPRQVDARGIDVDAADLRDHSVQLPGERSLSAAESSARSQASDTAAGITRWWWMLWFQRSVAISTGGARARLHVRGERTFSNTATWLTLSDVNGDLSHPGW